jgi:hypothetical protein
VEPGAAALIEELLDRWQELEPARRLVVARGLLQKVDATHPPDEVALLDDAALRMRLRDLLGRA